LLIAFSQEAKNRRNQKGKRLKVLRFAGCLNRVEKVQKEKGSREPAIRFNKALLQSTEFSVHREFLWNAHAVATHAVTSIRRQKSKQNKSLKKKNCTCIA